MKTEFKPATSADRGRVIQFLKDTFHATGSEPALDPRQMQWKYEQAAAPPHAWSCRNYILDRDNRILAHAGVWPVRMLCQQQQYPGAHLIDWAADEQAPGAGVSLLQKLAREEKIIYGFGGSAMTRKIFPSLGFRPIAVIRHYARPVRPLRQILTHPRRTHWKAPLRLVRNAWWSRSPGIATDHWSAVAAEPHDPSIWPCSRNGAAVFHRDRGGFEYLSRCPVVRTEFYTLRKAGQAAGYFLLVFVPGQARIADAWVADDHPRSWEKLFALAEIEARKHREVAELTTIAGLPEAGAALSACGFRQTREESLMAYDPQKMLPPKLAGVHFQLVDNDAWYRYQTPPEYQT